MKTSRRGRNDMENRDEAGEWRAEKRLCAFPTQTEIRAGQHLWGRHRGVRLAGFLLNHCCYPSVRATPHWSHHNHLRTSPNSVGWQQVLCKGQARTLALGWSGQMGWGEGPPWETWRPRSFQPQCELCVTYGLISSQIRHLIKKVIISVNLPGHFMGVIN